MSRVHMGWGLCAFAALVATALNPTYVSRLVLSSYADAPTTIAVGFAGALIWMMLDAISDGDEGAARSFAWQSGLAMAAAISLKQVNLVFLIALTCAVSILALRDPTIRWRAVIRMAPYIFVLPLAVYGAWRLYVSLHITGGEFSFRPFDSWFIALIPDILSGMALVASKKGGYFGIMTVSVILALRVVWRPRSSFDRLAILTATMFLAYNGFLLLAYVASFGKNDALTVGSFWRYNTHLGGVSLVFAAYSLAILWRRYVTQPAPTWTAGLAIILVLALPVAMGEKLRFDTHARYGYARATAEDIARRLSATDRLLLIDLDDNGQYMVIMRYAMYGSAKIIGEMGIRHRPTAASIREQAVASRATHIWTYSNKLAVTNGLDIALAPGASYLLARRGDGWSVVAQWRHPRKYRR